MGFGCLIAGFVLLFNPVIHVVDILPDAIGFLLIVGGLTKMSFFISKIAQARDLFWKLAFVEIAKLLSILIIPYADGSTKTLLALVFGVVELILFIPAVNYLFEGLSFAGLWYNGTAMYAKKSAKHKKGANSSEMVTYVRDYILFFYIFRVCASFIPELTELQLYDNLGEVSAFSRSLNSFKPYIYILFLVAGLIIGVLYIRCVTRFFHSIEKDEKFISSLKDKYENDVIPRDTFFIARTMKQALAFFTASVITSFVMTVDNVNVLVGVISSGFLIAASVIVGRYVKQTRLVIPIALLRCVFALFNMVAQFNYFAEYDVSAIDFIDNAYVAYYRMGTLECIEYALAAVSMLLFMVFLMKAIKQHLEVCGVQNNDAMYSKKNHDIETYNTVGGKILLCSVLAVINYILSAAYHFILVSLSLIILINSVVTILWVVYTVHTVATINTMLYNKEIEII